MKFNELSDIMQKPEPKPDTYEAGMAQNQLLKIGTHAIKIHNMIDDGAEMEAWVAKKIDLASNYVKSVHGYTAGSKAGTYDDDGMTEDAGNMADMNKYGIVVTKSKDGDFDVFQRDKPLGSFKSIQDVNRFLKNYLDGSSSLDEDAGEKIANMAQNMSKDEFMSHADELGLSPEEAAEHYEKMSGGAHAGKFEDAGEGHMSKSQLYQTAKMAIELLDMIKKGDDLEGWVQTKLNLAADYLQAVYHYEDYQKLNPYREEIDGALVQKHAGIIQKHLDEILARETETADVDTKPGMMRILSKRVNEVEKEIAKENRKQTNEAPPGMGAIGQAATKVGSKILSKIPGMGQKAADLDSKAQADQQLKDVYKTFRDFAVKTGANANKPQASTVSAFLKQMNLPTTPELQGLQGDPMVSSKTLNTILTKATQGKVRGAPAPQQQAKPTAGKGMSPDVKKIISGLSPQQKTQLAKML